MKPVLRSGCETIRLCQVLFFFAHYFADNQGTYTPGGGCGQNSKKDQTSLFGELKTTPANTERTRLKFASSGQQRRALEP